MNDIQCPNCGKAFKIDESGYVDILRQVRVTPLTNRFKSG